MGEVCCGDVVDGEKGWSAGGGVKRRCCTLGPLRRRKDMAVVVHYGLTGDQRRREGGEGMWLACQAGKV